MNKHYIQYPPLTPSFIDDLVAAVDAKKPTKGDTICFFDDTGPQIELTVAEVDILRLEAA